ncbi:MAG TPA: MMPL family transporter [Polyangiaceae bacterium]|nr:MMPL family transporter [Polyangiaceae bacterium]
MVQAFLERLGRAQTKHPWTIVLFTVLTLLPASIGASRLTLRTSLSELLPDSKPSVIEMRRDGKRLAGSSTLTVVAEGKDTEALKRFVDAVVPKIVALGPSLVGGVDDGPRRMQAFFEDHKYLYADLDDLKKLRDDVVDRYDAQVARAAGFDLGLDDEDEPKSISIDDIVDRLEKKAKEAKKNSPGVDGYYIGEGGKMIAVLVRTPFETGDPRAFELRRRIEQIIDEVHPTKWDPTMHFGFTGNLLTSAEQQHAIVSDLTHVGMWGVGFILGVVFLFFLRLRTLLAMTATIATGCLWAFGVASVTVGYLNTATGFLVSIIVGNGINFGIIYMGRYTEARRDEGRAPEDALMVAHRGTWSATLSAAGAAMVAYGSLSITDFRGFKHFGIIGGSGMILCWIATYLLLPAVLMLTERAAPMFTGRDDFRARFSGLYGRPFAWLAGRLARPIALSSIAFGAVAAVLAVKYFTMDPMEYDLHNIRNDDIGPTPARLLSLRVDKIVGRLGQDGRAILVQRLDQVKPLIAELERRRDAAPEPLKPFSKVVSIYDLVPNDQEEKIALVSDIKSHVLRARQRHFIGDADWRKVAPELPDKLATIGIPDLPEDLVRPFSERDGTRGRVVYIVPAEHQSVSDAHYLMRWADSFREVKLPNGDVIHGTGDPVIFSDMLIAIGEEAPKAVFTSFVGTLLVVLFAFRGKRAAWITLGTLTLGLAYLVAFLELDQVKLNFLNFVALPISIGVGADYALNMMARREKEPSAKVERVIVETGGAVILCSLTTTLGYLALLLSINGAVRSFGLVAAVGEMTTLLAAVLVLPSVLLSRRKAPATSPHLERVV